MRLEHLAQAAAQATASAISRAAVASSSPWSARILEIISPGGFEHYFDELSELLTGGPPEPEVIGPLAARYGIEFQPERTQEIIERFGLKFGPAPE